MDSPLQRDFFGIAKSKYGVLFYGMFATRLVRGMREEVQTRGLDNRRRERIEIER